MMISFIKGEMLLSATQTYEALREKVTDPLVLSWINLINSFFSKFSFPSQHNVKK